MFGSSNSSHVTTGSSSLYVDDLFSTYTYIGNGSNKTIENGIALGGYVEDPYWDSIQLLLHGEGTNGASVITDSSKFARTITTNSGVTTTTASAKYGTTGLQVTGGDASYMRYTGLIAPGVGDFTYEGWFYPTTFASTNRVLMLTPNYATSAGFEIYYTTAGLVRVYSAGEVIASPTQSLNINSWNYVKLYRKNGIIYSYVNGVLNGTTTFTNNITDTEIFIGGWSGGSYAAVGYLEEVRITNAARPDITTPSAKFGDSTTMTPVTNGGLVWTKARSVTGNNVLCDSSRGAANRLFSNLTAAQDALSNETFNSNGFSIGAGGGDNNTNAVTYVSWTFRKAPKFFDVVTYTGDGTATRFIPHSLACACRMVISKATSTTGDWNVYHSESGGDLVLNSTAAKNPSGNLIMQGANTTHFVVNGDANTNGVTYVAYLFAHDTTTDGIIQCGSLTGGASPNQVLLGWEPQFILYKVDNAVNDWVILDSMRGMTAGGTSQSLLKPNLASAESTAGSFAPNATGFYYDGSLAGSTYIYLAIRRPNKPPTTGTQVYNAIARTGTAAETPIIGVGFAPDLVIASNRDKVQFTNTSAFDKLRGPLRNLLTDSTAADTSYANSVLSFDPDGLRVSSAACINQGSYINWFFKRAPGVFDVVCWTTTGSGLYQNHSLGVTPELIMVKDRNVGAGWYMPLGPTGISVNYISYLNGTGVPGGNTGIWGSVSNLTATKFPCVEGNFWGGAGLNIVAYLFATKAGISKVGSYTGNGSSQTINCGFTTGARFVLIKRTDSTGDWFTYDTVRGIIAGNDPHLSLNTNAAEVTTDDTIDPDTSGFIVNQVAATNVNVNAATYIYLAFA